MVAILSRFTMVAVIIIITITTIICETCENMDIFCEFLIKLSISFIKVISNFTDEN